MASSRKSRSADPHAAVAAALEGAGLAGRRLCIGFSGGVDSMVLLHVLHALRETFDLRLAALHVNHGLSPQADRWQQFCESCCARLGVELQVRRVVLARRSDLGLEAAAREARMAALAEATADWVVLAHHRDDQAETLLFRLLRGSGLRGAAAIAPLECRADGLRLFRPLLTVGRAAIERYAVAQGLEWIEDESNRDCAFDRNFLRHAVLPQLAQRFPAAGEGLARAAAHFRESLALLDELGAADWGAGATIARTRLVELAPARQRNLLRWRLHAQGLAMPEEARLHEALRQLLSRSDAQPLRAELGGAALCHYRGRVWVEPGLLPTARIVWEAQATLPWGGGQVVFEPSRGDGIARSALCGELSLGPRVEGEGLRLQAGCARRSIKNLCQEAAIPPWLRNHLPMLRGDGRLLWVAELGVSAEVRCGAGEDGVLPRWLPPAGVISRL